MMLFLDTNFISELELRIQSIDRDRMCKEVGFESEV